MSVAAELLKRMEEAGAKCTFKSISRSQFEALGSSDDYEETEIDGHRATAYYEGDNCVAVFYEDADVGSQCSEFKGDVSAYSESDSLWPFGD